MSDEEITVLMPAYNAARYIGEAIESVLAQTFSEFELLIINDGSTDDTEIIIRSFTDKRIIVVNQENQGISAALNKGLSLAKADYIARFDADDICHPERLEMQYNFLQHHADHIIVGCSADYLTIDKDYVFTYNPPGPDDDEIQKMKMITCPFIHSGVCYKKKAITDAGGYNMHAHTFEDHFLWLKVLQSGKGHNLSQSLLKVRLHPSSVTIDEKWRNKQFIKLKTTALKTGTITEKDGNEMLSLIQKQETGKIKKGTYHILLGKKYLWDNHQPEKARHHIGKALSIYPGNVKNYFLWLLSFLPKSVVMKMYSFSKKKSRVFQ